VFPFFDENKSKGQVFFVWTNRSRGDVGYCDDVSGIDNQMDALMDALTSASKGNCHVLPLLPCQHTSTSFWMSRTFANASTEKAMVGAAMEGTVAMVGSMLGSVDALVERCDPPLVVFVDGADKSDDEGGDQFVGGPKQRRQ